MLHPFQVYRFYEYWINFESWRDFTGVGAEHKIDDAMSRDEKRYYAKVCHACHHIVYRLELSITTTCDIFSVENVTICYCRLRVDSGSTFESII
jgi:hypothetical protein